MVNDDFRAERARIRAEMGGADKIERLHRSGRRTAREHIADLVDQGSFHEIGTFARSERPEDQAATPADGKICGHATIDGRPVTVVADDVTVKRATSSLVGARKLQRVYEQAARGGHPFVYIGETGGARLPDTLSAVGPRGCRVLERAGVSLAGASSARDSRRHRDRGRVLRWVVVRGWPV
jgi:acetyl-CoA carboxylase carboxyltransferase component